LRISQRTRVPAHKAPTDLCRVAVPVPVITARFRVKGGSVMDSFKQLVGVITVALLGAAAVSSAALAAKSSLQAYLDGQTEMGNAAAAWAASQTAMANSRSSTITSWANTQAALVGARATMVKSVADANSTNARTLQTIKQTRSITLEADLKAAKTFYEKRKLHEGYRVLHSRKSLAPENLVRYSKNIVPGRLANYQIAPCKGKIKWPLVLQEQAFLQQRLQIDSLFLQRQKAGVAVNRNACRRAQDAVTQMRNELRARVRQMSHGEYLAARKFIDSLAFETRPPKQIQAVATR